MRAYVHGSSFTDELRALAHAQLAAERAVFTGERSDIPRIMAACDVFTLPSQEEPFGLVFLEAMVQAKTRRRGRQRRDSGGGGARTPRDCWPRRATFRHWPVTSSRCSRTARAPRSHGCPRTRAGPRLLQRSTNGARRGTTRTRPCSADDHRRDLRFASADSARLLIA